MRKLKHRGFKQSAPNHVRFQLYMLLPTRLKKATHFSTDFSGPSRETCCHRPHQHPTVTLRLPHFFAKPASLLETQSFQTLGRSRAAKSNGRSFSISIDLLIYFTCWLPFSSLLFYCHCHPLPYVMTLNEVQSWNIHLPLPSPV